MNLVVFELSALLVGLGLTAFLLFARAELPALTRRADAAWESRSHLRRFLLGLLNGPGLFVLAMALGSRESTKLASLLVAALLVWLLLWGLVAIAPRLGRRVLSLAGREGSELARTLTGGGILTGTFLFPLVGWIAVLAVFLLAIGTGVSAIFARPGPPAS